MDMTWEFILRIFVAALLGGAIGLACGGGLYILAAASTFLVLVGLEAFNYFLKKFDKHRTTN